MASADASAQGATSGTNGGLSAAQRLMAKHDEAHKTTVEEVPDEEDLTPHPHPASSSIIESVDESAPGWAAPMSTKAAGKQKEAPPTKENKPIDTQSNELFPGLSGAQNANRTTPIWGAKSGAPAANGNGVATNGSSTPKSGANTPRPNGGVQSLAGQVTGPVYTFEPKELPRSATRKPLPEVLRDINKKYRANLTQTTGEGGVIKISAGGSQIPDSIKRQAFKELGSQINTKVGYFFHICKHESIANSK